MPLETGTFISDLNSSNPAATDGLLQGDDHIRLIKRALKSTFPNFSGVAVSATEANLNAAVDAVNTSGVKVLADTGAFFKTNTTDGITNPAAGEVDLKAGGQVVAQFKSDKSVTFAGNATVPGVLNVTQGISGPGVVPVGGTIIWWSDTLPDANWAWANGGTYLRSNTALWNLFGTTYGTGDGSTTANLPDLRDNVPVGKGTMGATVAAGRITNFVSSTLGSMWGECLHLLGITELPKHNHAATVHDPGHSHTYDRFIPTSTTAPGGQGPGGNDQSANTGTSFTGISVTTADVGGDTAHNNVQPSIVCNYIIRIA